MRIKARQIKPGMVINIRDKDYALVTSVKGYTEVECTHFNYSDGYMGRLTGYFSGEATVKVVTSKKKRAKIIKSILTDVFKLFHDAEDNIALIKLIQAMES